jgi:hypothetical protein
VRQRLRLVRAFVIIGYHDRRRGTRAHDSPLMVDHLKMDVKSDLFAMVPAIACYTHGEDDGPGREVELLWAVELEQTERSIRLFRRGFLCVRLDP